MSKRRRSNTAERERRPHARPGRAPAGRGFDSSWLRWLIVGLVALEVAGIILVFEASNIGSFDLVKSLYSRGTEWLIAATIGIALVRYGPSIVPRTRLHAFVIAYLLAAVVSAAFAENVTFALFGDDHRYLGVTFFADMAIL